MCGFAGLLDRRAGDQLETLADSMAEAVRHRGPDDQGVWADVDAGVGLAHRRLSIIDTSSAGRQPFFDRSGRWVLSYNGEIYNYIEMAAELDAERPIEWRTGTDTEVLVEAIARWGVRRALERTNGMFAFAVWDRKERRLTLARDRLGEKPCYYAQVGERFLFGSELRALEAVHHRFEVDPKAVNTFLRFGYIPDPWTIYEGAHKLEPGKLLEVDFGNGMKVGTPETWWSLLETIEKAKADPFTGTEEEAVDELEALLLDSVRLRLRADVPIGTWLSGGIDSTLVTALAQQVSSHPVKTFTVAFPGTDLDESEDAAKVAAYLGTDHTTISIDEIDPESAMQAAIDAHDEPFADPSSIAVCLLAERTREHVTVALAGDGGDELFAGYNRHFLSALALPVIRALPPSVQPPARRMLASSKLHRAARAASAGRIVRIEDKLQKLSAVLASKDMESLHNALMSIDNDPVAVSGRQGEHRQPESPSSLSEIERMLFTDSVRCLPSDMLVKTDRCTMAVGLESRLPLLDHRLVPLSWSVPLDFHMKRTRGKRLLRRLVCRLVERELIARPKLGFDPPVHTWLRTGASEHPYRAWSHRVAADWSLTVVSASAEEANRG